MLRPFAAYLRVYEPISVFGDPPDAQFARAVETADMTPGDAITREQWLWLRSQLPTPTRVLPAETSDGRPLPGLTDILVLDPAEVPVGDYEVELGTEPLVCPLDVRARSAAALTGFLDDAHPALRAAVLDAGEVSEEEMRGHAGAALRDLTGSTMHVLSTTWTVPLPWFTLVDPDERRIVLGSGPEDPSREVSWRVAMSEARQRVAEAEELVSEVLGDEGPARILAETRRWLANFHPNSAVELDYGGLVQLIEDPVLATDTSADEVHAILDALRRDSVEEVTEAFENLRDYWGELASRERFN